MTATACGRIAGQAHRLVCIAERPYGKNRSRTAAPAAAAAGVAELADALDLGSSDVNRGGSNPPARTITPPSDDNDLVITGFASCK